MLSYKNKTTKKHKDLRMYLEHKKWEQTCTDINHKYTVGSKLSFGMTTVDSFLFKPLT